MIALRAEDTAALRVSHGNSLTTACDDQPVLFSFYTTLQIDIFGGCTTSIAINLLSIDATG